MVSREAEIAEVRQLAAAAAEIAKACISNPSSELACKYRPEAERGRAHPDGLINPVDWLRSVVQQDMPRRWQPLVRQAGVGDGAAARLLIYIHGEPIEEMVP